MKCHPIPQQIVVAFALVLTMALAACSKPAGLSGATADVDYWTCTMHPSVHSKDPGECPICSMDLVPVVKKGGGNAAHPSGPEGEQASGVARAGDSLAGMAIDGQKPAAPNTGVSEFSVPVARQQQIGVTYTVVEKRPLQDAIRSVGMAAPDRKKEWGFVARVDGYVQKLEVTSPGERVEKGQPLMTLYSPDLRTAERELVDLLAARDRSPSPPDKASATRLIESSERRLEQWNLMEPQVAELERSRQPTEFLTLYSPFTGVVEAVPVQQGRRVTVGDRLVDVVDLSEVWVWAQFYENELSMVQAGQPVVITTAAFPGHTFAGKIGLLDPFINEAQRTAKVRIDVPNPELKLRPGMYLNVDLKVDAGERLAIPVSAVMPTGARSIVFIDKGNGKLEGRIVQLGGKFGDFYQVQGGLKEGERVVASANFLIDAESKVQGALKDFEEPPGEGFPTPVRPAAANGSGPLQPAERLYEPLIDAYLHLKDALAQDKMDEVNAHVAELGHRFDELAEASMQPADRETDHRAHLAAFKAALAPFPVATLDQARIHFGELSAQLIHLLGEARPASKERLYVLKCPMWDKSPGSWIQRSNKVENPFLGSSMPECGSTVDVIAQAAP
ncbi:MAG TPA: efflux RND transporter periplasmic adaptor subunit [Chthoniobacterales bacterium]